MDFTPNRSWKDATQRLCAGAVIALLAGLVSAAVPGTARSGFPGTNGKIAFVSYRDGNAEIYVMDANGSGQTRLTNNSFDDTDPAWSADGSKIAFTRTAFGGSTDIYVMNADGTSQSNVTRSSDPFDRQPTWSPDGTKIAFTGSVGSLDAIFVVNADGSGRRQVSGANGQYPAWSPDGRQIAFQGGGLGGFFDIWVVDADGAFGSLRNLTNNLAGDYEPDWSPTGREIVFESSRGGTLDLYKMTTDGTTYGNGSNVLRLRAATLGDSFPTWSPDGNQIAFQHEYVDNAGNVVADIHVMDSNGLIGPALTNDGLSYGPDWQPATTTMSRPVISCGSADGAWHGANVSIACTAHDDGSGLADPADAKFSLATAVPDGTEDGIADTGTRRVCNQVGNCATAGPIRGNKIDRKAPTLSLPADQTVKATSSAGATVTYAAAWAYDGADPNPSVSCSSASGSVFPIGSTAVGCTATDHVGNTAVGSFVIIVLGFDTPAGSNVVVRPVDSTTGTTPLTVTFTNVTTPGDTTLTTTSTGPAPAAGFDVQGVYYELGTTAAFDSAEVCFPYASPPAPPTPSIMHWVGGVPVIEPTTQDTGTTVCALVTSFSPFALVVGAASGADTAAPTIACGSADGAWHGTNVSIACTAHDDGSGLANPADAAFSLTTSVQDGTEVGNANTGTRQVCDRVGNCATAGPIGGNKIDRKAPTLSLPADQTVDATSPAGAAVSYSPTAADGAHPSPRINCSRASGASFAIGTTTVACTATDHVGNASSGSFHVTVLGAKEQLSRLVKKAIDASKLPPATKTQLVAKLQALVASFDPNKPAQRQAVCSALKLFTAAVHLLSGHGIPAAQAAEWSADANRIRAVLGC